MKVQGVLQCVPPGFTHDHCSLLVEPRNRRYSSIGCVIAAAGVHKVKPCSEGFTFAGLPNSIAWITGRTSPGAPRFNKTMHYRLLGSHVSGLRIDTEPKGEHAQAAGHAVPAN